MSNLNLLALSSKATYSMLGSKNKTERLNDVNRVMTGTGFTAVDRYSDRDIIYLKNDELKKIIVAHRGTDVSGYKTAPDLKSDFLIALGQEEQGKQFNKRSNRTKKLMKSVPDDYTVSLVGHSYGGSSVNESLKSSKYVADRVDEVATFNAGFSPFSKKGVGVETENKLKDKVIHYRIAGDAVSASVRINKPFGTVKEYRSKDSVMDRIGKAIPSSLQFIFETQQSINAHKIDNFLRVTPPSDSIE